MTKIQIELPELTAKAADEAGLLTPEALDRLLTEALRRRKAGEALLSIAERIHAAGIPPMAMEEIDAEVKAYRAERRACAESATPSAFAAVWDNPEDDVYNTL
jgi:hypothetical protein